MRLEAVRIVEERPEPTRMPRLWSAKVLAERFCVSFMTLYRAYREGHLPGYHLTDSDRSLRFLEADVLAWLGTKGIPINGARHHE